MKILSDNSTFLFIPGILFITTIVTAQVKTDSDPKAKAILDEVSAKTKSYSSILVEFEYSIVNKKENISEKETGKLLLKGKKYRIEIPGQEIICDEKTVWTFLKDANEVQINIPQTDDQSVNPTSIFTLYEKGFKFQFVQEETIQGKICQVIKLFPQNPGQKPYHTIKLVIDKTSRQLTSLEVYGKDGGTTTYLIKKFVANPAVDDSTFTFIAAEHPGIEVIDLR